MIKTESKLQRGGVLYMNMVTNVLLNDQRILAYSAKDTIEAGNTWTTFEIYWKDSADESNIDLRKTVWDQTAGIRSYEGE